MRTLLLERDAWDLCLTANRSIATCTGPYARAQDAASACRLFLAELWYDKRQGVPYFQTVLGHFPPLSLLRSQLEGAALTVPGVLTAKCFISGFKDRTVTGQVQITTADGTTSVAAF